VYKKHYPPILSDNIWRLKNIGKDGPIDKRLESEGVKNVQDFLKLNSMDPDKLKNVSIMLKLYIYLTCKVYTHFEYVFE
jgi:hypothetical protein